MDSITKINLKYIQRQFNSQKNKLIKKLENIEKEKRAKFFSVMRDLENYRNREGLLKRIESKTSAHLKQITSKINSLRKRDSYDKKRINRLIGETKKLKMEIPRVESKIEKMRPQKIAMAEQERNFLKKVNAISNKVKELERKRNAIQKELKGLLDKERMLRQGKIYWSTAQKKATKTTNKKIIKRAPTKLTFLKTISKVVKSRLK